MIIERPALYIVGTPIGNLGDLSARAAEILANVDFIAAEDTRVSAKLLNHLGIKNELVSYHEHNVKERGRQIIERLRNGACAALCTDAGMPAISDPGQDLVDLCHSEKIPVHSVPGPTAAATALSVSGLASGRFCFEGFLSVSNKKRAEHLFAIADEYRTMIFYEAPHKLRRTIRDLLSALGDREIALCRELTKLHEEVERTTLAAANEKYKNSEPKGEYVIIVSGAAPSGAETPPDRRNLERVYKALLEGGATKSDALKTAASKCGFSRNEAYKIINMVEADD